MNKYLLLATTSICVVGTMSAAYADESTMSTTTTTVAVKTISPDRLAFQEKARLLREKNKEMHATSQETRKDFRTENKDAIKENKKSLTPEQLAEIQKVHDERKVYVESLKDLTPEQKALKLGELEAKIKAEIELKYQNATGALSEKRMSVYEQNAVRRSEMVANQLEIRSSRGTLRISEVDAMIAKITIELPNLSTEKKTKLAKKIDEKIIKIQANKRLPDVPKAEIIAKLTALRNEVVK